MPKLFLRLVGGFGARLLPLLQTLTAVEESGHHPVICWPQSTGGFGECQGRKREQSFEAHLLDLYDFNSDLTYTSESNFFAKAGIHPHYSLRHTQNLDGKGKSPVYLSEHLSDDLCVNAHGVYLLNPDSLGRANLDMTPLREMYHRTFKLKESSQTVYDSIAPRLQERHTVGVYIRQSRGANRQVLAWDAQSLLIPKMDEHVDRDNSQFFVVCDDREIMKKLVNRFSSRVITTPKPGVLNHPAEMLSVTTDIALMRLVDVYYPTWGSWLGKLFGLVREGDGKENPLGWGFGRDACGQRLMA
jgi:hypothetical protein